MTFLRFAAVATALATLPVAATASNGKYTYNAFPVTSGVFEIESMRGSDSAHYWCGAGHYVGAELGRPANQRVYVIRADGPSQASPGRTTVQFSLTPPTTGAVATNTIDIDIIGNNLSQAQAYQFCFNKSISD